mmetsp:Transcript_28944/g.57852  ORF Transcript_28944/g.57852 Transcript_28944/m.57852 type:complete len:620 (+) Transcript_28944:43-1902(+)
MGDYRVPTELVSEFSPQDVADFKQAFGVFDENGDGSIDANELATVLTNLNESVTASKLSALIAEVDSDGNHTIEFGEFCHLMSNVRKGNTSAESGMAAVVKKASKLFQIQGAGGGSHSFSEDEKIAFTEHLNNCLGNDADCSERLPIDPMSMDLFSSVRDGVLLAKLINCAQEDTIDERALNKNCRNTYQEVENLNLVINAAKAIGCTVVNVGPQDLQSGSEILILGLIWQIVKIQLLSSISLKNHPELVRLLEDGETLEDLLKLPPEQILLRWFNYHLAAAGHPRRIHNFGSDIRDAEAYSVLLHQIAPNTCDFANESDTTARAQHVINNAAALEVPAFIKPADITSGNKKLNLAFVAQIFNTCPALEVTEEELLDLAGILDDDVGDTREERVFRMWVNSLGIDDVYVNDLFADLQDGVVLLRVMDRVQPGIVAWNKVNINPRNRFKKVENCNYAVVLGKQMRFSLVNVGGVDLVDGNKKLILAIMWQLMRLHTLNILRSLSADGQVVADADIVAWANQTVQAAGKTTTMSSFRDSSLSNGLFLIDLLAGIESRIIDWDIVQPGSNDEECVNNAKYAISIARKLGACVFLTCDDIFEVKSKMIMTFCASLWATSLQRR